MSNTQCHINLDKLAKLIKEQADEINNFCCKSEVAIGVINGAVITICAYSPDEDVEYGFEGVEDEYHCLGAKDL